MGFANKVSSMPLEAQSLASYLEAVVGFLGPTRGYLANERTCATEKITWTWSEGSLYSKWNRTVAWAMRLPCIIIVSFRWRPVFDKWIQTKKKLHPFS